MTSTRACLSGTVACILAPAAAFADLPPIYDPGGGPGLLIAGVLLSAGVIVLGVWYVRRKRKPPGGTPA